MPQTPITTEIHQPLDIHGNLPAQIALDLIFGDFRSKFFGFLIRQFPHFPAAFDIRLIADRIGSLDADAINRRQSNTNVLLNR